MTAENGPSNESLKVIERLIQNKLGTDRAVTACKRVSGGCIAEAFQIKLDDGLGLFAKVSPESANGFDAEISGLEALRSTNTIAVPEVFVSQSDDSTSILILQWIESSTPQPKFWKRFGHQIARLHLANDSIARFGFSRDNFIGSTDQKNTWTDNWPEFFAHFRIAFQGDLALERGLIDPAERQQLGRLIKRLPSLLTSDNNSPALIHGDLWSGNFLCDANQNPVIFDPAVYFGHHECEFGITRLFGGFDSTFYQAYHEVIPTDGGTIDRIEIYQLYHLLNHVNLFGRGYWPACHAILSKYT